MLGDFHGRVVAVDRKTSGSGNDYANVVLLQRGDNGSEVVEAFAMASDVPTGSLPAEGSDVIMRADVRINRGRNGAPDRLQVAVRAFFDAAGTATAAA